MQDEDDAMMECSQDSQTSGDTMEMGSPMKTDAPVAPRVTSSSSAPKPRRAHSLFQLRGRGGTGGRRRKKPEFSRHVSELRIKKDIRELSFNRFTCDFARARVMFPKGNSDLLEIKLIICPIEGPYRDGSFDFLVEVPAMYPFNPPKVTCLTKVFHPNICIDTGKVYLRILESAWSPVLSINNVLLDLQMALLEPNQHYPLNTDACQLYVQDRTLFDARVRESLRGGSYRGHTMPDHLGTQRPTKRRIGDENACADKPGSKRRRGSGPSAASSGRAGVKAVTPPAFGAHARAKARQRSGDSPQSAPPRQRQRQGQGPRARPARVNRTGMGSEAGGGGGGGARPGGSRKRRLGPISEERQSKVACRGAGLVMPALSRRESPASPTQCWGMEEFQHPSKLVPPSSAAGGLGFGHGFAGFRAPATTVIGGGVSIGARSSSPNFVIDHKLRGMMSGVM